MPYHWGRYRGLADMLGKPALREHVMKNLFFDTCVYHQPGIDLLAKVIDAANILFGSGDGRRGARGSIRRPADISTTPGAISTRCPSMMPRATRYSRAMPAASSPGSMRA
ncbi:MAG: hypothetical protein WDN44_06295 [Sphingomonas sp.]